MKRILLLVMMLLLFFNCSTTKNSIINKKKNTQIPEKEAIKKPEYKKKEIVIITDEDLENHQTIKESQNKTEDNKTNINQNTPLQNETEKKGNHILRKKETDKKIRNHKKNKEYSQDEYFAYQNTNKSKKETSTYQKDVMENLNIDTSQFKIIELDLRVIDIDENKNFYISLKKNDWMLQKMKPDLIKMIKRENFDDNTLFHFKTTVSTTINMTFIRYNLKESIIYRQPFTINVRPKSWVDIKETDKESENQFDTFTNTQELSPEKKEKSTKVEKRREEEDHTKVIANQQFDQKKYKEARDNFLSLINSGKGDTEIYYKMGIIEKDNKNNQKAMDYFLLVLNDRGHFNYIDALLEYIKLLKNDKKFRQAVDAFYQFGFSENLDSRSAEELYLLLADVYFNMKDYKSAAIEYRRFIKKFPYSTLYDKALFYLAYALENFEYNPDFKESKRLYNILIDNFPESRYYNLSKKRILHLDRHYLKIN